MPRDTVAVARAWLDLHPTVAVATVVKTWGSAPVPAGGQLVIAPDDRVEGSVSGGCVEAAVITEAHEVMRTGRAKMLSFGVSDEQAFKAGLPCGGSIEIYLERLAGEEDRALLSEVAAARDKRRLVVVGTDLDTGQRALISDTSVLAPEVAPSLLGGACHIAETADGRRTFYMSFVPQIHLVLVGAGHVAQVLADLALCVGYKVTVIDPRSVFASPDRFGPRVAIRHEWPEAALAVIGLDAATAVISLAHMARLDDEALVVALASPCFYIGALGSKRTHGLRLERLMRAGLSSEALARIDAPIGLPIGASGPAEIAVSILAGIVKAWRGGRP